MSEEVGADVQYIVDNFIQLYSGLVQKEPHLAVHNFRCENSDYSDQLNDSKNAYLCFNGYEIEDCYYTFDSRFNKNCMDMTYSNKCELCFECIDCDECYSCDFCQDCERCRDCEWCVNCLGCENCFGCVGLRKGRYCIFNEKVGKEEYERRVADISEEERACKVGELELKIPRVVARMRRSENCTGDYVFDSKNVQNGFKAHDCEDCVNIFGSRGLKNCCDLDMIFKSELCYDSVEATDNYNCDFIYWCANCVDCEYVMYCFNCENCFGCFNLKRKKFCILNKAYEELEYWRLVGEIKAKLRAEGKYQNFLPDVV